ncbi:MAG: PTS transporter subunit EIIB, partial [Psychrilyobacter sp.]|uniref:PTS transporter subunit EIIB n=1 Tax=Psychrilyobacter sp. TaxID=2586924 RepID=UPI003C77912C
MDYNEIVKKIMKLVGGKKNISGYTSCMTRLRISVEDLDKVDTEELKKIKSVLGLNENGDELQLIFGPGKVKKAYTAMDELYKSIDENKNNEEECFEDTIKKQKNTVKAKRTSKFQGFMANFSNIFVPLIPGFIAAGMLAGLAGLCK